MIKRAEKISDSSIDYIVSRLISSFDLYLEEVYTYPY